MKRLTALIVLALLLVPGLVFARGGSEPSGPQAVTLTIAGRGGAYGDAMQLAADAYTAANPNVTFEYSCWFSIILPLLTHHIISIPTHHLMSYPKTPYNIIS